MQRQVPPPARLPVGCVRTCPSGPAYYCRTSAVCDELAPIKAVAPSAGALRLGAPWRSDVGLGCGPRQSPPFLGVPWRTRGSRTTVSAGPWVGERDDLGSAGQRRPRPQRRGVRPRGARRPRGAAVRGAGPGRGSPGVWLNLRVGARLVNSGILALRAPAARSRWLGSVVMRFL